MDKFEPTYLGFKTFITMSALSLWFHNLLRPTVKSVHVIVYEKNTEKDIGLYPEQYLAALVKAIDGLWTVEKNSPFWFETEVYERHRCFKKIKTEMIVTCYSHDITASGFKKRFPIPIRYRKKFFDKKHLLLPEPVGVKTKR